MRTQFTQKKLSAKSILQRLAEIITPGTTEEHFAQGGRNGCFTKSGPGRYHIGIKNPPGSKLHRRWDRGI